MGDGGVAYVPLQQQQQLIMESLSVTQKSLCGGKNGNNGFKMVKIKKDNKGKKGESERSELESRKSNEEVENGEIVDKVPKEEVEEGELGTLKWPKIESENGEFWSGKQRRSDFERVEIGNDKWRRAELEKGEFGSGKWRKGDLEKAEFRSWRTTRDEIEKGEFIPDRWSKLDARKDEYFYSKQRRHDSGREKNWKFDHEWTPPHAKYASENALRRKDFSRSGNHHGKTSSRWEFMQEKNLRLSSKIVDDDSSHKSEHDNGKECGPEPSPANRLKRYTADFDSSERKYHGDYGDYAASKSRRLSDDCSRPAHSENQSRRSADKSFRQSSSKISSSDKYSSRHPEFSSSSRVVYDRHGHSPGHSERSPHDRVKHYDGRDRSPVGRNKSPYIHDRSPYGRERSPCDRIRYHDHRNRSPSHTERSFSRGRSPFDRSRYYDYRNRSPTHSERSPQNRSRYHDSRGRTPKYLEKSPHDCSRTNDIREANRKGGLIEKHESQNDNKGDEEKLNRKDPGEKELNTTVKESLDGVSGEKADGLVDKVADSGPLKEEPSQSPVADMDICETPPQVPEELASMEEDMDICDTPPHAPVVTDSSSGKWFYLDNVGMERGPAKLSELKSLVEEGVLMSDHFIKHLDSDRWVTVENAASPMVVMNFPTIVSDTVTQLVSPPEAPGNLLADSGDAGQSGIQKIEEVSLKLSSLDDIAVDAGPPNNLYIDERIGALLEGFPVIPGKEIEIIGEALQTTFERVEWEGWEYDEGYTWNQVQSAETHDREVDALSEYSDSKSLEVDSRLHVPSDRDSVLLGSDSGSDWYSSRWSCKGGDWQRNDDASVDRSSKKRLVLNDGFPLCQMPKSGCEDPRWQCKDELYYPSHGRRLDLPPWAFSCLDEKTDSNNASKLAQIKPMLMRGVKGTIMPVVRINACVVKDHGSLVSEPRIKARGRDKYSSRSGRPFTGTSDAKRSSTEGLYHSRSAGKNISKGSWKDVTFVDTPKDRLCLVDELQLHLGDWYYLDGAGHEQGPLSLPELQKLVDQGVIQKYSSVFRKSDGVWVPVASVVEALGGTVKNESSASACSFKSLYPQFIGYTCGKLHELVMKSYKSREFAAAINEVLDPWINAKQPKKEMENHYRKTDGDQHASKRARMLIDANEDDDETEEVMQSIQKDQSSFEDLCGDNVFYGEETTFSEAEMGPWGLLNGYLLARVFHFLRSDLKSLIFASLTCKHWRASVMFYKGISKQVDFSSLGISCSDYIFQKTMDEYRKEKVSSLVLVGCANITSSVLEEILCSFPSLSSIDIRGCSQFLDLVLRFPNICWIKSQKSVRTKITGDLHSKMKSLKQIAEKTSSVPRTKVDVDDFGELKEYFDSVDRRDSASHFFRRSLYKRSKVFDARKSSAILSRDARIRRWAIKKSEIGYKRMEGFVASSLKEIMKENTFDFFVPKVAEIEDRMNNGYYISHGLSSVREDISRMCRDAIKAKNRGDAKDMNRIITLFIQLATRLEGNAKTSHHRDEMTKSWKEDLSGGFNSSGMKYKKLNKVLSDRRCTNRSNGPFISGQFDHGEAASDREIKRRLSKLNRRSMDSGSETSEDHYDSSEDSKSYSETTASEAENDQDLRLETRTGGSRGDGFFSEDESLYYMNDDREWGARMTKASLVPPVTRKYEVIDQYVVVADEMDVRRKMRVALPEDYAEKLNAQRNGSEESDMELPEVKDFKPRKQLGDEVIEQEVYGIDPYTHNLLLDSMPEEMDWPLSEKHMFIEDVLLHTLNKQVRSYTGTGSTPMMYDLRPVIEEIVRTAEENHDMRILRMCQGILKAMDKRPDDKYVAYRKGLGVVCNKEGGFGEDDFVVEFLGEVYPAWKWFEKQDGIRSLQKNDKDPAPEFYNIYLERPKGDADGYDLVVVDAMHKANYASRICHSCRPNCEAKVTAVNGQYQIGIYSVRPIQYGEEITFDYNSVTESKEEYEASVCLCGSQVCRGSYLNLTGEGAFQKVLKEWHGLLDRLQLMLEACELNSVTEEDYIDLGRAGLGSCLLGGLPDWLIAYAARLVRFINFERTKLPNEILRHNLEEKRKYFSDICLDMEKSDAEIQAEGVYNQRLQNLAITLDKVRYVMRCIFGDPKKAPPPLEKLSPEDAASFLWNGEGSLVEELLQSMAPHMEDGMLNDLKSKIHARDPISSDNVVKELRKSLLWLRDEIRNLPCTYKCRHDAAADLIHIYAYTKYFFRIREYQPVTSSPVYISPLDLGPKYADKLGGGLHEYRKQYGENYCLGQLIFWHVQTNADPDSSLIRASRGCLSLPDIGSFYAKKPQKHCVYGPRTVKFMLSRMEKQPQRPWPKDRIWSFKSSPKVFGSPMLDAVVCNSSLNREMVNWLRNRPTVYQEMWDR